MKKTLPLILVLFLTPLISNCATIYGTAMDERNVGTIASDHKIKSGILSKYADDEHVGVLDFSVSSYEGHVYLIGEYETGTQKNKAIQIAKSQEGVADVTTYLLRKNPKSLCSTAKNLELTASVKAKLVGDKDISSTNIDVKTIQCITVLWGLVGSKTEINKAIAHAKSVDGVAKVNHQLETIRGLSALVNIISSNSSVTG